MISGPETSSAIIIGAGPVGVIVALRLAMAGVKVTIIERDAVGPRDQRASTVHPPTLDMLAEFGIIEAMISRGLISPYFQYRDHVTGPVAKFDLGILRNDVEHPYRVSCSQWKIVEIIFERLLALDNVQMIRPATAEAVTQGADKASVLIRMPDGTAEPVEADWAIACDGIRSDARNSLGIEYEGYTITDRYWVLSTYFDFADVMPDLSYINYVSDSDRWYSMVRGRNYWRVLFPTTDEMSEETLKTAEAEQAALRSVYDPGTAFQIVHRKLYRVHQRVAQTFRKGRVLLAGDAAHANSPLGGQGMNSGIHDAFNLTDKLLAVMRGEDDTLLDRYSRQRKHAALHGVQAYAKRNEEFVRERDPVGRMEKLDAMRRIAVDPQAKLEYVRQASMMKGLAEAEAII